MTERYADLNPPRRLLMGPGPIDADPRVLRAMAAPLVGQFDPWFRALMAETMALWRHVFQTANPWTLLVDGTARAGIEAAMVSLIEPGDTVLVGVYGRFGWLKVEIAERCGAKVEIVETDWGTVFQPERIEAAIKRTRPKIVAICHGDTSTTMLQPLDDIGHICRAHDALLLVDATASLGGNELLVDAWAIDVCTAGLQKCMAGPSGSAPVTLGPRAVAAIEPRRHVERGIATGTGPVSNRPRIASNYFDLAMIMDYWGPGALNHHTEATSMLYAARECARIWVEEGATAAWSRHARACAALRAGLTAMGLMLYGDEANRMANVTGVVIPDGVDGERVRARLLNDFHIEIGTSFGPLKGRIWRIGTMGVNARLDPVLATLGALEAALTAEGCKLPKGEAVQAALGV